MKYVFGRFSFQLRSLNRYLFETNNTEIYSKNCKRRLTKRPRVFLHIITYSLTIGIVSVAKQNFIEKEFYHNLY